MQKHIFFRKFANTPIAKRTEIILPEKTSLIHIYEQIRALESKIQGCNNEIARLINIAERVL